MSDEMRGFDDLPVLEPSRIHTLWPGVTSVSMKEIVKALRPRRKPASISVADEYPAADTPAYEVCEPSDDD